MPLSNKSVLITGGAGFIGSNAVDKLLDSGNKVIVYDNLSGGRYDLIAKHDTNPNFKFVRGDLLDIETLKGALKSEEVDTVFHMAANPEVNLGRSNTRVDLEQGTIATHNLLEAMRICDVNDILFTSSSAVYGLADVKPTPETYGNLKPISMYGASKLASEGLITSFSYLFDMNHYIFRFANVVGRNPTHGIVKLMIDKLRDNRDELYVLGTGIQNKSYVDVDDIVDSMLFVYDKGRHNDTFNISTDDRVTVDYIVRRIVDKAAKGCKIRYSGSHEELKGDIADTHIFNEKIKSLGFKFRYTSREAIDRAIDSYLNTTRITREIEYGKQVNLS
ncbi:MAG: NAD-dependent epimerase/dehydratase family protein [Candidatus Marsarchaeota archaeon]|jgi:UDP-glucose 4-epimerase|nr:NAD-dependent epimerase/dehydratase family protein [Candidatus Marsarchaeota archaeon]